MQALLLSLFDAEMARTATVLAAVPDQELDWAPHPRSLPLGRLAMHVATLAGWMSAYTDGDGYDMGPAGPGPAAPGTRHELDEAFARARTRGRTALASCDDASLSRRWTLWRDGQVMQELTRGEAIATFALHHLAHHRGQLTVYLRLRGIAVPALYGDSADLPLAPAASPRRQP